MGVDEVTKPGRGACVVCLEEDVAPLAAVPCGHQAICSDCIGKFSAGDPCPVCRVPTERFLKVFVVEPAVDQRALEAEQRAREAARAKAAAEEARAEVERQLQAATVDRISAEAARAAAESAAALLETQKSQAAAEKAALEERARAAEQMYQEAKRTQEELRTQLAVPRMPAQAVERVVDLEEASCAPGDAVQAVWAGNGRQYPAVIQMIGIETIKVEWNDGATTHCVVHADKVFKNGVPCSNLQVCRKHAFETFEVGARVEANFKGTWYLGTVRHLPEADKEKKNRYAVQCDVDKPGILTKTSILRLPQVDDEEVSLIAVGSSASASSSAGEKRSRDADEEDSMPPALKCMRAWQEQDALVIDVDD